MLVELPQSLFLILAMTNRLGIPFDELIRKPASADRNPVLNEMTTLRTAARRRLEKVVEEETTAAANAPEHTSMTQERVAFG